MHFDVRQTALFYVLQQPRDVIGERLISVNTHFRRACGRIGREHSDVGTDVDDNISALYLVSRQAVHLAHPRLLKQEGEIDRVALAV